MQLRPVPVWGGRQVYPHAVGVRLPQGLRQWGGRTEQLP